MNQSVTNEPGHGLFLYKIINPSYGKYTIQRRKAGPGAVWFDAPGTVSYKTYDEARAVVRNMAVTDGRKATFKPQEWVFTTIQAVDQTKPQPYPKEISQ